MQSIAILKEETYPSFIVFHEALPARRFFLLISRFKVRVLAGALCKHFVSRGLRQPIQRRCSFEVVVLHLFDTKHFRNVQRCNRVIQLLGHVDITLRCLKALVSHQGLQGHR